jgi:hypothetical protein
VIFTQAGVIGAGRRRPRSHLLSSSEREFAHYHLAGKIRADSHRLLRQKGVAVAGLLKL